MSEQLPSAATATRTPSGGWQSPYFLARLLGAIGEAVVATRPDGRVIFWSPAAERLYGWTAAEAMGRSLGDMLIEGASREQGAAIMESLRRGATWRGEFPLRRREGASFPALVTIAPVLEEEGRLLALIGVARDLTELKQAEAALRHRVRFEAALNAASPGGGIEHYFRPAVSLARDEFGAELCALLAQEEGGFRVLASEGLDTLTQGRFVPDANMPLAALAARSSVPVCCEDLGADPRMSSSVLLGAGLRFAVAAAAVAADGPKVFLLGRRTPGRFETGQHDALQSITLTLALAAGRERAVQLLRRSERRLHAVVENVPEGVLLATERGRVVVGNSLARELLGAPADAAFEGRQLSEICAAPLLHSLAAVVQQAIDTGQGAADVRVGARRLELHALRNDTEAELSAVVVLRDVTQRREMETRLMLADRMASVGTLAAGVAHELNNPLSYVLSNLRFVADELRGTGGPPDAARLAEIVAALDDAANGAERMRVIVRDLMTFSRFDGERKTAVSLEQTVDAALKLTANELRHRAKVVRSFGPAPLVLANEARLGQVFVNLLVNAAQAIPEGNAAQNTIEVEIGTEPDGRARVVVSDTGQGIAPEVLPHIFEPFFTTKGVGEGTGLGLSVCHSTVTSLGGDIDVLSEPGRGARVTLRFPPHGPGDAGQALSSSGEAAAPRPARILVIDDEQHVLTTLSRILRGYEVVAESSAERALEGIGRGERYDLILCDVMMPDVTGIDFHDALAREAPELLDRLVLMTGGAFTPRSLAFLDRVKVERLEKPFDLAALKALLARKLGAR